MTPSIHQSWRTVAQWHRLRKMTEISNMQHRQAQHVMICVLLPQKRGVSTPQSSSIFMILVDVQHPRVPKSAFIPQNLESSNSHTKPPRFFQFPESQIHLQSIIQGMQAILGFVRTLRNLNISSCNPDFSKCSAIQNLHDVFSSLSMFFRQCDEQEQIWRTTRTNGEWKWNQLKLKLWNQHKHFASGSSRSPKREDPGSIPGVALGRQAGSYSNTLQLRASARVLPDTPCA